jgi:hypothetical protein
VASSLFVVNLAPAKAFWRLKDGQEKLFSYGWQGSY